MKLSGVVGDGFCCRPRIVETLKLVLIAGPYSTNVSYLGYQKVEVESTTLCSFCVVKMMIKARSNRSGMRP
jgi:hypothetical protein